MYVKERDPNTWTVLTRKYKLDDGQRKYVETTTLLEPSNEVPIWESGKEELKELSQTLGKIRKNFDNVHKEVEAKKEECERMKKHLEEISWDNDLDEQNSMSMKEAFENAKGLLDETKTKHKNKMMEQWSYYHMIDRMKKDLIAQQIETNSLAESLKDK